MILVLNGPNLNLLGQREPEVYGRGTLADLEGACERYGLEAGVAVRCRQSNHEGELLDWLHGAAAEGVTGPLSPPAVTWAEHGDRFVAGVENGPLSATQFHPEKSGDAGAQLLTNWLRTLD